MSEIKPTIESFVTGIRHLQVHDNTLHNPDYATDAAFLAHSDRHQWLAADELNIKDAMMEAPNVYRVIDMSVFNGFDESVAGSGSTVAGFTGWRFITGATQNSVACRRGNLGDWINYQYAAWRWRVFMRLNPRNTVTGHKFFAGWLASIAYPIDLTTQVHVCFEIDTDGKIYACVGDGTNYTRTYTGVTITANGTFDCYYKYMENDVTFYINRVLRATISAYRPRTTAPRLTFHESNPSAAADQTVYVYAVRTLGGAE
jgi:hypothetical protein